jgi:serine/threonine protein kinase
MFMLNLISGKLSPQVATLWFRAPELLYGATMYGPSSDMWSVGCIMAQLLLRAPLFHGSTELEQLSMIFGVLGTPTEVNWPGVTALPRYTQVINNHQYRLYI